MLETELTMSLVICLLPYLADPAILGTARMNWCADEIIYSICDPQEETECRCNENNGHCKKWIRPMETQTSKVGDQHQITTEFEICVCEYRCRLNMPVVPFCDDDSDCVKDTSDEYKVYCPYGYDQYIFTGENCY